LGGATDIPFSQSAQLQGNITISSKPTLAENWRLNPNASATLLITNANLQIADTFRFNASSFANRQVQPEVETLVAQLNSDIAADPFLENAIRKIHKVLCQTYVFDVEGESAWLKNKPVSWNAEQPMLDDKGLTLKLDLAFETSGGTGMPQRTSECRFPDSLKIDATDDDTGTIELKLATSIEWDIIRSAANDQLAKLLKNDVDIFRNKFGAVSMNSLETVEVRADGQSLLTNVSFEGSLDSWWDQLFSGHVWLRATPILDSSNQTISFRDVQLDSSSEKALSAFSVFGLVAGPMLKKRLESLEPVSLAEAGRKASAVVNSSIEKMLDEIKAVNVEVLAGTGFETRVDSLHVSDAGLNVLVVATGGLSLRVNEINLSN